MPNLFVYEPGRSAFCLYAPSPAEQMPHVRRFFFPTADFMRGAGSAAAWTDARALFALDALGGLYPAPFTVCCAFKRWPDTRRNTGLRFSLIAENPARLRACALESGLFSYVSPPFAGGPAVTVTAACAPAGRCGVHIFALQDALMQLGLFAGPLSGTLCADTRRALCRLTNAPGNARISVRGEDIWIT